MDVRGRCRGAKLLSAVSPHPGPMTRSLPLSRPSRACASHIPFAASQAAQVPTGEGDPLLRSWRVHRLVTQSHAGLFHVSSVELRMDGISSGYSLAVTQSSPFPVR